MLVPLDMLLKTSGHPLTGHRIRAACLRAARFQSDTLRANRPRRVSAGRMRAGFRLLPLFVRPHSRTSPGRN
jgi:hypothetical protein